MSIIRTILGDIAPEALGICYSHEHVIIDSPHMAKLDPEFRLDSVDLAVRELEQFHKDGGRAMVDSMPCGGRNILKMAEISRRSGVHLLIPTGLHLPRYYPSGHWGEREGADSLARRFEDDLLIGIDVHDYDQPVVERTGFRAGLLKIATGGTRLDHRESKIFEAAAMAHRRTGAPILTHTEQGRGGLEQMEALGDLQVDLGHVVLSHTDRYPDVEYHRDLLSTGVFLEYDSAFRWQTEENPTLELILKLLPDFPGQLLLGMDAAKRKYWKAYGGSPGLSFLLKEFRDSLRQRGAGETALEGIFLQNPARVYSMKS